MCSGWCNNLTRQHAWCNNKNKTLHLEKHNFPSVNFILWTTNVTNPSDYN